MTPKRGLKRITTTAFNNRQGNPTEPISDRYSTLDGPRLQEVASRFSYTGPPLPPRTAVVALGQLLQFERPRPARPGLSMAVLL